MRTAHFHLPGLFEFYDFYSVFLELFFGHRDYFYDWCDIGSIYGAPTGCLWGGGRTECGKAHCEEVLSLVKQYGISPRLTFSNSLLKKEHLDDKECNELCRAFEGSNAGVIICSDLLLDHIKENFPDFYFVSSTTKVITDFNEFLNETDREDYKYVVPDFRLNKAFDRLAEMTEEKKDKVEFLVNECCPMACRDRKACYENVSRKMLGEDCPDFVCSSDVNGQGYRFSKAMESPAFISADDIINTYLPMGFSNFKIEGRTLGSAMILEFLLYYMTKPECRLKVREEIYLDAMLDLF